MWRYRFRHIWRTFGATSMRVLRYARTNCWHRWHSYMLSPSRISSAQNLSRAASRLLPSLGTCHTMTVMSYRLGSIPRPHCSETVAPIFSASTSAPPRAGKGGGDKEPSRRRRDVQCPFSNSRAENKSDAPSAKLWRVSTPSPFGPHWVHCLCHAPACHSHDYTTCHSPDSIPKHRDSALLAVSVTPPACYSQTAALASCYAHVTPMMALHVAPQQHSKSCVSLPNNILEEEERSGPPSVRKEENTGELGRGKNTHTSQINVRTYFLSHASRRLTPSSMPAAAPRYTSRLTLKHVTPQV